MYAHRWPIVFGVLMTLTSGHALAQDLTQGKTPAQLFAGDCAVCHKSPQGLAKDNDPRAIANFLREHYTTKPEMADALAAYVLGSGGGMHGQAVPDRAPQSPGKPRTAATADVQGDTPKPPNRARPAALADESKPPDAVANDAAKPTMGKPRNGSAVIDANASAPPKADENRARRNNGDEGPPDDSKSKRRASGKMDDGKKPGDAGVPAGKLNSYARSGLNEKDEAAESVAKLRDYAASGEGAPTVASAQPNAVIGSPPTDMPMPPAKERTSAPENDVPTTASGDTLPQSNDTSTAEPSETAKAAADDKTRSTRPRKSAVSNDGKPQEGARPRRPDPANNVPMSPTAFFGRLFSGGAKPSD